jgi:transcriptional regulator GlxA family with amidase domain
MVVYHRRSGGQSQFSAMLELEPPSDRIRDALKFAREHLHEPLSVERMAGAARTSARQFALLVFERDRRHSCTSRGAIALLRWPFFVCRREPSRSR